MQQVAGPCGVWTSGGSLSPQQTCSALAVQVAASDTLPTAPAPFPALGCTLQGSLPGSAPAISVSAAGCAFDPGLSGGNWQLVACALVTWGTDVVTGLLVPADAARGPMPSLPSPGRATPARRCH